MRLLFCLASIGIGIGLLPSTASAQGEERDLAFEFVLALKDRDPVAAGNLMLADSSQDLRMPAIPGKSGVTAVELVERLRSCNIYSIKRKKPPEYLSGPASYEVIWGCKDFNALKLSVSKLGQKVHVTNFGRVLFAPPPVPSSRKDGL